MKTPPLAWLGPLLVACASSQMAAAPAPTEPTAAATENDGVPQQAVAPAAVNLRSAESAGSPVEALVREAVLRELTGAGFAVASSNPAGVVDLLLTVTGASPDGGAQQRVAFTLSATVEGHEMEDVSGHFVLRGAAVDDVTVREVCQRWKRRYRRFREASHPADL
jgi:hypothetical protein